MASEFVRLQGVAVVNVAKAAAQRIKAHATLCFVGSVATLVLGVPMMAKQLPPNATVAYKIGYMSGSVVPVIAFAILAIVTLRRAKRVERAAKLAFEQPTSQWFLRGDEVAWVDARGLADATVSFRITPQARTFLLSVGRP